MGSLGETLRQARLDRGASLADAERETRVRRKYLEALEAEDYTSLPALVHTRGFIRVYARYLGLDPDGTLDLFGPARVREERPVLRPATPRLSAARPASSRLFMGLAGMLVAGLLFAYLWTQYNSFVDSLSQADREVAGRPLSSTPTPSPELVSPTPAPTPQPAPTAASAAAPEGGVVVEARVTDRTWMEVWTDGVSQLQSTLQGGSTRSFSANRSIRMRVGNAGGVQVTVNGQSQGLLGDRNQVKEFVWER